jgi:MFS family permease
MSTAAAEAEVAQPAYGRYAWWALALMVLVYAISFLDRQILSILAESIKADLGVNDAQLGFLYGTAFAVFYTLFGIPLGRLVDHWHRARLMAIGLTIWSLMTLLSGFASSLAVLAIARVGVGIGEASASPAAYSMLADYFPERRRALVLSIYSAGLYLGQAASMTLGGSISTWWDRSFDEVTAPLGLVGWQAAFIAVGLPGLLLAPLIWNLREPRRRVAPAARAHAGRHFLADLAAVIPPFSFWTLSRRPGALRVNLVWLAAASLLAVSLIWLTGDFVQWIAYAFGVFAVASWAQHLEASDRPTYALIWGTPTVLYAILGFGGLAIFTYSVAFWAPPFAMRSYGVAADRVGYVLGIPAAAASAIGMILGGRLSDLFNAARGPRGRVDVAILSLVTLVPLVVATFSSPDFTTFAILTPICLVFASMWPATAIAAFQDFVLPRMYGTIGAIFLLATTMVGLAIGPYTAGKVAMLTGSLRMGVLSLLLAAPLILLALWRVRSQVAEVAATRLTRAGLAGEPAAL